MELELVPEDQPEAENLPDNVIPDGYDPKNSADKLEPDDRYFLVDPEAERERRLAADERSGLPKYTLDYIDAYCES